MGTNDKEFYTEKNLISVDVTGVKSALEKHEKATPKGIKVHFSLDDSGFFSLTRIEHLFEEEVEVKEEPKKEDKKKKDDKKDEKEDISKMFNTINMDDFKDIDWSNPDPEMMKKFQEKMNLNKDFDPSKFDFGKEDEEKKEEEPAESENADADEKSEETP